VAEIVAALAEEYDAPPDEIQADVLDVLSQLAGERLVTDGAGSA
jgi:hypothetical protein